VTIVNPTKVGGEFDSGISTYHDFKHFEYGEVVGEPRLVVNVAEMIEYLKSEGIPSNRKVQLRMDYLPRTV